MVCATSAPRASTSSVKDGPIGVPLLAVASEVSGTTTLYRIDARP
jgi:hypothetical protein